MKKVFLVSDLDGTLITSGVDYGRAIFTWVLTFMEEFVHRCPHYDDLSQFFLGAMKRIDKERYPKMKARRDRFPGSMVLAYREVCQHFQLEFSEEFSRRTFQIGLLFCDEEAYRNRSMIPGAQEMLSFLRKPELGAALYCVTAGDMRVQWAKWRGYRLGRFFPTIREFRVVKWEKEKTLRRLRKLYPSRDAYMVGDSIGSRENHSGDLWPAYRAGFTPIYVAHPSVWDNGDHIDELPPGTISLEKIQDVAAAIYQLPLL
ncbi:MAG: hypothetical protein WEC39_01495 [Patescibacteria group bacterium]